jgi:hypothetical protein
VEKEEVTIGSQRHGKHIPVATDIDATIEDMVFSMWPVPMLYNDDQLAKRASWRLESAVRSLELHCWQPLPRNNH